MISTCVSVFISVAWLDEHHEAIAKVNEALTAFEEVLDEEDFEVAKSLATTAHDSAHDLINSVTEMGEADSGEEGHEHESGE